MITTITELLDGTSFERMALETSSERGESTDTIDLEKSRVAGIVIREHTSESKISQGDIDRAFDAVRPLLFGAAWKCLDLAVEYGLHSAGEPPDRKSEYSISIKVRKAVKAAPPPLAQEHAIWSRIAELFAKTDEVRHSLIHRVFALDPKSGAMTGMKDRHGASIDDLTSDDQSAFGHLAQLVCEAIERGSVDGRLRCAIVYQLDRLHGVHKMPAIGGGIRDRNFPRIIVSPMRTTAGPSVINLLEAKQVAATSFPNHRFVDVVVRFERPGPADMTGRLEEAPSDAAFLLDVAHPPDWLR